MARTLHRAIEDALRESDEYRAKGILVTTILEATLPLQADDSLLYRAVYTIFRALPLRLLPGTILNISTTDVADGVELMWEGREPAPPGEPDGDLRSLLAAGPHGDLLEIAILALESFCHVRAGYVETRRQRVESSSFSRPPHVIRRVLAHIPLAPTTPSSLEESAGEAAN